MAYNTVNEGIVEWSKWWYEHRDTDRSMENEIAFLKTAINGLLDLVAVTAVEMQFVKRMGQTFIEKELEKANENGLIITPRGFRVPE